MDTLPFHSSPAVSALISVRWSLRPSGPHPRRRNGYKLGETTIEGMRAIVAMKTFQRGDYRNPDPDPDWRRKVLRRPVAIHLAGLGQGWQIMNIVFLPHQQTWSAGVRVHPWQSSTSARFWKRSRNKSGEAIPTFVAETVSRTATYPW